MPFIDTQSTELSWEDATVYAQQINCWYGQKTRIRNPGVNMDYYFQVLDVCQGVDTFQYLSDNWIKYKSK